MVQNYSPMLFSTAAPESPLATESCSPKLCFKATSQRFSLFNAAVQSCSEHLRSLPRKHVPDSDFPKLLSTAIPQTYRIGFQSKCPSMLFLKPQRCSPQLLPKAALQSCYRKPRPKNAPQNSNAVTRSCFKAGLESCPKMLPNAVPRRCSPKLCAKAVLQSCCPKAWILQTCSRKRLPKPFCKAAPESCASNLLPKAAVQCYSPKAAPFQIYTPKRLAKAILPSGSRKLLPKLLLKAAPRSCL